MPPTSVQRSRKNWCAWKGSTTWSIVSRCSHTLPPTPLPGLIATCKKADVLPLWSEPHLWHDRRRGNASSTDDLRVCRRIYQRLVLGVPHPAKPNNETALVTFYTTTNVYQEQVPVTAHSRTTIDVNRDLAAKGASGAVSALVQVQGTGAVIVAERPIYFMINGGQGGSDVIGYTGR